MGGQVQAAGDCFPKWDDQGFTSSDRVSGPVEAALDAVQGWRYQPTLLNGEPWEVDTIVAVKFSLVR